MAISRFATSDALAAAQQDITATRSDVAGVKTDVATVLDDVGATRTDVAGVAKDVAGVKTDVATVKTNVDNARTDIAGVKTDVDGARSDIAAVQVVLAAVQAAQVPRAFTGEVRQFKGPTPPAGWTKVAGEANLGANNNLAMIVAPSTAQYVSASASDGVHIIGTESGSAGVHKRYDESTGNWVTCTVPPPYAANTWTSSRPGALVGLADGRLFMCSYGLTSVTNAANIYDPATGAWTAVAPMPATSSRGGVGVQLTDGRVLVVDMTTTWLYNPATNTWAATFAAPALSASQATAYGFVRLPSGKVLVAVGNNYSVFDPVANAWSAVKAMPLTNNAMPTLPAFIPDPLGALCYNAGGGAMNNWVAVIRYLEASDTWEVLANLKTPLGASLQRNTDPCRFLGGGYLFGDAQKWLRLMTDFAPVSNCFAVKN
ncbi:hypothetical protein [Burkholderia cepacia]|uniref:hypothetical protein n=1 Tax=Burkholderia cepacia TaxID=292 RepID=UPI000A433CDA|nr:hypothetical protein [Burkholderia cepacia]